jgi:hypothetical protein
MDDETWERRCLEAVKEQLRSLERFEKGRVRILSVELEGTRPDATIVVTWTPRPGKPELTARYPVYGGPESGTPVEIADAAWLRVMES